MTDLYEAMLGAIRVWMAKYHPEARGCGLYVWIDDDLPPIRITIPASCEKLSAHRPE